MEVSPGVNAERFGKPRSAVEGGGRFRGASYCPCATITNSRMTAVEIVENGSQGKREDRNGVFFFMHDM